MALSLELELELAQVNQMLLRESISSRCNKFIRLPSIFLRLSFTRILVAV